MQTLTQVGQAEVKGRRDPCSDPKTEKFLQEEVILCRIRAYKDEGIVDMCPAFSPKAPIKIDIMRGASYTQEQLGTGYQIRATGSRFSYVYWIFNDTEPEDTGGVLFFSFFYAACCLSPPLFERMSFTCPSIAGTT